MNDTTVCIVGNLAADPELRFTQSGAAVANFTVMSTPQRYDRQAGEMRELDAITMRCTAWQKLGENVAETLTKGMRVIVRGELRTNKWEDREGNKREQVTLDVTAVGPDLRFATAKVTKAQPSGEQGAGWSRDSKSASDPWGGGNADAPF